jgi:hypothetical protein
MTKALQRRLAELEKKTDCPHRRAAARTKEALWSTIGTLIATVPVTECGQLPPQLRLWFYVKRKGLAANYSTNWLTNRVERSFSTTWLT